MNVSFETRTGDTLFLSEIESPDYWTERTWWRTDDSELSDMQIRFNFYLARIRNNLDTYGVAVNRYLYNLERREVGVQDESYLMLINDIVRVPEYFDQEYYYELQPQSAPCLHINNANIAKGYILGRVVKVGDSDIVKHIGQMMDNGAVPAAVKEIIADL